MDLGGQSFDSVRREPKTRVFLHAPGSQSAAAVDGSAPRERAAVGAGRKLRCKWQPVLPGQYV